MGNIIPNPPPELDGWRFFQAQAPFTLNIAFLQAYPDYGWESSRLILSGGERTTPIIIESGFVLQGERQQDFSVKLTSDASNGFKSYLTAMHLLARNPKDNNSHEAINFTFRELPMNYAPASMQEIAKDIITHLTSH